MFHLFQFKYKNLIINKLKTYGAISPETALTLKEAGIINPDYFTTITEKLLESGIICKTPKGCYYLTR